MIPFFKRDDVWTGMLLGIIVPLVVYGILILLYAFLDSMGVLTDVGFAEDFRTRTLSLVAICCNLLLMQNYRKTSRNETIRGMLIASMILVVVWFFRFGIKMLHF